MKYWAKHIQERDSDKKKIFTSCRFSAQHFTWRLLPIVSWTWRTGLWCCGLMGPFMSCATWPQDLVVWDSDVFLFFIQHSRLLLIPTTEGKMAVSDVSNKRTSLGFRKECVSVKSFWVFPILQIWLYFNPVHFFSRSKSKSRVCDLNQLYCSMAVCIFTLLHQPSSIHLWSTVMTH